MMDYARRLEGTVRNVGTHAAGVVIAPRPLEDLVPLQKIPNKDKEKEVVSTQWEMGDVEKAGLLKMDFLGLRNLTSLDAANQHDQHWNPHPAGLFWTSIGNYRFGWHLCATPYEKDRSK